MQACGHLFFTKEKLYQKKELRKKKVPKERTSQKKFTEKEWQQACDLGSTPSGGILLNCFAGQYYFDAGIGKRSNLQASGACRLVRSGVRILLPAHLFFWKKKSCTKRKKPRRKSVPKEKTKKLYENKKLGCRDSNARDKTFKTEMAGHRARLFKKNINGNRKPRRQGLQGSVYTHPAKHYCETALPQGAN